MSDTLAIPTAAPPPQAGAPLTPAQPTIPAAQPDLVPVIDVGGESNIDPAAKPGEPGSGERPIFLGAGGPVETHPIPGDDQVKKDFLASRSLAQAGNPWANLDALIASGKAAGTGTAAPVAAGPTTPTGSPQTPAGQTAAGVLPDDDQPIGRKLTSAASAVGAATPAGKDEAGNELDLSSVIPPLGRVAYDISKGGIESPQAILRGMLGGIQQTSQAGMDIRSAVDQVLPTWLSHTILTGASPVAAGLELAGQPNAAGELSGAAREVIPEPSTVTGGLIEQGAQFGTGLVLGNKAAEALKLTGVGAHLLADVVAGATSMDPNAPRLSNLIDEVAPNFLTEWLKAKPGQDNALMGRLKSGLEFAGLGAIFEGLKAGLGTIKQAVTSAPQGFGRQSALGQSAPLGTTESFASGNPPRTGAMPEGVEAGQPVRPAPPLVEITPRTQGAAETVLEQQAGMGGPPVPEHVGAPVSNALRPIPEGWRLTSERSSDNGYERFTLVDESGKIHYFAHIDQSEDVSGAYGVANIGNISRAERGIGPSFYQAIADELEKRGGKLFVGLSASDSAKAAHRLLEAAGALRPATGEEIVSPEALAKAMEEDPHALDNLAQVIPTSQQGAKPTVLSASEVQDYIAGRSTVNPIRINLLRIGSGDDIRNILEQVARTIPEPAVVSNEATVRAADALGVSPSDFLNGYRGQNLNASETTAMRFVLDSSAQQLIEYAHAAADPLTNTDEVRGLFLKAFATHDALQKYYVNARAEAGRTLQAWSILSQTRPDFAKAVQQLTEQAGQKNVEQMAADIASLEDPIAVSRLVAASQRGTGRDTFLKAFYNVLLSNPRTIVKKLASDTTVSMWNLATTYAAEKSGSGAVVPGETGQLAYGLVSSFKDAIRMAGKGLKAGESQFFKQFNTMDWQDKSRLSALANGAPEMIPDEAAQQAGSSWLRAALPTSWIGAADDFAKYVNYRGFVRQLSYRDGVSQNLDGPDLATHIAQTMQNVPDSIHQEALANTLRSTFQEPLTGVLKQFQDMVDDLNVPIAHTRFEIPVGRIILPFVKTPANIMRWSYNNSPLAMAFPSSTVRAEMAAGGATRDMAMARMWLGSAVALGFSDFALNNVITGAGPRDPQLQRAWRAAGNEPYSVQFPGQRPVSYNMVEPLGMMMGAVADTFGVMKFAREDGRENLASSLMFGAGHAMLSKTYLQGVANVLDALDDPERNGDRVAQSIAMTFLSPQGVAAAAHASDPYIRYHRTLLENEESRLPIVSQRLPPARTLWGDPIPQKDAYLPFMPTDSFTSKMLSPWQLGPHPEDVEPIDKWIWENHSAFPRAASNQLGISKPSEFQSFEVNPGTGQQRISAQVHLDPEQYDRFQQLAGNELRNPDTGMGAKDTLNALVTGSYSDTSAQASWNQASPAMRALWVQRVVNGYRRGAQVQLRQEFPDLEDTIRAAGQVRTQQLQGQ